MAKTMIKLSLDLKKEILKKLNKNRDQEYSIEGWFDKELLSEFGYHDYEFHIVDELLTEDDGKWQNGGSIYQVYMNNRETDMYIMETWARSGSYYSDYYYVFDDLQLCEKYTRTIEDWRVI